MQIFNFLSRAGALALDAVLPPRCVASGAIVERAGGMAPEAWTKLIFITNPMCRQCGLPFGFGDGEDVACGVCLRDPPPFSRARAALVYDDGSRDMILRFKHADQIHAVHTFTPWLSRAGAGLLADADILAPVPLHRWRMLKRRYNQAALLAQALGRKTGVACVPDALVRLRPTPSQGRMRAGERRRNVRAAFAVNPGRLDRIAGRNVLVVDDVMTTGSTVSECARALLRAGAARVDVLALARVVRPGGAD